MHLLILSILVLCLEADRESEYCALLNVSADDPIEVGSKAYRLKAKSLHSDVCYTPFCMELMNDFYR